MNTALQSWIEKLIPWDALGGKKDSVGEGNTSGRREKAELRGR